MSPVEPKTAHEPDRYRVFLLRHISAKEGIQFLSDANIKTVSQLNDANMLLVTAQQEVLIKVASLLTLVDSREKYAVKVLLPASEATQMPSAGVIAAEIGNTGTPVSVGTFFSLPGGSGHKVIIDVHGDGLIAVAPASVMERIVAIAERVKSHPAPYGTGVAQVEPKEELFGVARLDFNEPVEGSRSPEPNRAEATRPGEPVVMSNKQSPEPDKLFNELLGSLAEAEKGLASPMQGGMAEQAKEPNQVEPARAGQPRPIEVAEPNYKVTEANFAEVTSAKTRPGEAVVASAPTSEIPDRSREAGPDANVQPSAGLGRDEKARRSYEPQPIPNADETLELTLPEKLDIISLLDLVGKYLNLNYVYTVQTLQGRPEVNLKVQGPIKVRELYPLAESILKFTGLAMTRKGNLVTIVPLETALDIDPALIQGERGEVQYGDVVVTRIFQLSYIDTTSARTLIEGMKVGAVTELPAAGTIIVTGYAYRMSRVEQLLGVIDKPGRPKQFKYRALKYTTAKTLAPKVKQLVEQMGDISIAIAKPEAPAQPPSRRPPSRQPTPQPQPAATPESAKASIYLDADERTNRILMIGHEVELAVVDDLIDALDVEQQDLRSLRMYEIQHVDAKEVKGKLEELGVIGAGRSTPGRITSARIAAPGAPGQPGGAPSPTPAPVSSAGGDTELPTEALQVVVIEATNSLLVNASPEQHVLIATIIAYVDSETLQQSIPYVVYPLENQKPTDLAEVLNKLIQETIRDDKGKVQQVIKRQEDEIVIVPDENTFSLIVFASKKNQEWISSLVKSLDKRRPQVLIDVTLVEVSKSDSFDYDLKLLSSFPDLTNTSGVTKGLMGDPNSTNLVARLVNSGRDRFIDFQTNKDSGVGFYGDRHINALLTAMQTKSYGRILAKPKILVNDNEAGKIVAKDTTYVTKTSSSQVQTGGVNNNLITSIDYQGYDAGITLNIKPHISEGELLRLEITLTRSDFGTITGDKPPDITSSDIDTVVTVPDGSTIILGGLVKLNQGKGGSKVPLLGDLPLVGAAFRSVSDKDFQKKLYIFVKAEIIRPEGQTIARGDLVRLSDRNRAAFEKDELEFQDYNDVPGTKPKPMDPIRVLDAE
jgi:type II secretory pathway component GspD/PulD (secretin)